MALTPEALRQMQALAQEIWREAPRTLDQTPAELAYSGGLARTDGDDASHVRLWLDGADCRAWGWFFPPSTLEWAVHPAEPQLFEDVLDWFVGQADPGAALSAAARTADVDAQARLRARGFVDDPDHIWMRLNHRTLEDLELPSLPPGYALRTVADYDGDLTKRVEVHRRSWAEHGTRVSFGTYPEVMATWPYRSDLDFVLEADDGTPVAFALGWLDEETGAAEFEPLGTDPAYRRRGLARALLLLGLRRFRDEGATTALVGSRGDDGYPAPRRLYESIGFRELSRQRWFTRPGLK